MDSGCAVIVVVGAESVVVVVIVVAGGGTAAAGAVVVGVLPGSNCSMRKIMPRLGACPGDSSNSRLSS